jgi:uncharacterized membrane protein (UPF0127 family)
MKINKYKYIALIMICIIAFSFLQCNNNPKEKKIVKTSPKRTELKESKYNFDNPPKFRHDGELNFVDKENTEIKFKINIEIASTDMERALGLMFRPQMDENKGMLFLMDREEFQSFYMRNTIIPLDIIYINNKFEIVDIYEHTNVLDDTSLPSSAPARYVVEINAGLCEKYGIKIGDSIYF